MNERRLAFALAASLALNLLAPSAALAQNHGGGGGGGGQGASHPAAPPPRPPAPPPQQPRPAPQSAPAYRPPVQSAPVSHSQPTHGQNGFSFPNDVNARPAQPAQPAPHNAYGQNGANHVPQNFKQAPYNAHVSGGPYHGTFHGPAVPNPHHWGGGWGWNHGVAWYPSPIYWGGGFWGPFALGALTGAFLFGSVIDYQDQVIYPSYQVVDNSPGAQLLQNYGLQQTECGPPDLVVIWGPDNSVICAYPNNLVAPGNYELDPTTLSIVSRS